MAYFDVDKSVLCWNMISQTAVTANNRRKKAGKMAISEEVVAPQVSVKLEFRLCLTRSSYM